MKLTKPALARLAIAAVSALISHAAMAYPTCSSAAVDPDGDGWGWENNQSCIVSKASSGNSTYPTCASKASDPDGDGWGWENNASCKVAAQASSSSASSQSSASSSSSSYPSCQSASSDPDGDGWGWENNASCKVAASFNGLVKGADVSWVDQQEAAGQKFYNASNQATDPFALLSGAGVNAIRLRVWVNPADGWNNGADVLYKAKRAKAQGQRIMIDFHYSDSWADPGKQNKPAAWASHGYAQLQQDVYAHTYGTLAYLKQNGIDVAWVQIGNEINSGMLWPEGSTNNFSQLAGLINNGYQASKAVYPNAKVVIHLANGHKNADFRWFFDGLRNAGAHWDVIGMSHYPPANDWASYNNALDTNMADMASRYGKQVIVCEVGMDWMQAGSAKAMITDLMRKLSARGGLGLFYWEPLASPGWQGYTLGALDATGHLSAAMDAYR